MSETTNSPAGSAPAGHPQLDELIAVLATLRAPGGCAWDREQTHESLVKHLVEESYELVDAIETGTREDLVEELGDVLYQVLFHADLAAEHPREPFTIDDVAASVRAKMVDRHPHVFGPAVSDGSARSETAGPSAESAEPSADEVALRWEDLKSAEKPARTSVLDGIPRHLPSLQRADKVVGRAERLGVTPATSPGVVMPTDEEELGALLLAVVADARSRGLDAERALRTASRSLETRIRQAEERPGGSR